MNSASFFALDSQHRQTTGRDDSAPIYSLPVVLRYDKNDNISELDAFKAVAQHMANIMSNPLIQSESTDWGSRWRAWEKQQFRKVVRRAKPGQFDRLALSEDSILTEHRLSDGQVVSFLSVTPHPVSEPDSRLKNFQVSGLALPHELPERKVNENSPAMLLNPHYSLGASTGKMLAQVCHAVQLMIYSTDSLTIEKWEANGRHIIFNEEHSGSTPETAVRVVDAGFTELPPNSVTVSAGWLI